MAPAAGTPQLRSTFYKHLPLPSREKASMQEAKSWVNWSNLSGDTPIGSISEKLVFQTSTSLANTIGASGSIRLHKQAVYKTADPLKHHHAKNSLSWRRPYKAPK